MNRLSLLIPLTALACAHKPAEAPQPAPAPVAQTPAPSPSPTLASTSLQCTSDSDCPGDQLCASGTCADASAIVNACGELRVHFAFDSASIADEDRGPLERVARCLRSHQRVGLSIEGNADDRGTEEYNLALGDRRANATKDYLASLGVDPAKLKTISYGKERPFATAHDEAAWAQNRRGHFVVTAR